jgi:hypothetical protein
LGKVTAGVILERRIVEDERRTLAEWEKLSQRRRMSERPGRDTDSLLQSLGNIGHGVQCSEAGRCAGDDG